MNDKPSTATTFYATQTTLHCALKLQCVPCAYKIGCFDVSLDRGFTQIVPNQRPELCPRILQNRKNSISPATMGFSPVSSSSVLTVGDGDFSFSLSLAKHIQVKNLTATSYETFETLQGTYPHIEERIEELKQSDCTILYNIDATKLSASFPKQKFDCIVWNFPCTAVGQGQDGQNQEMEENQKLVRLFSQEASRLLSKDGEIVITHKTKPPFDQWRIQDIALQDCSEAVEFIGSVAFDRALFPPYVPRKALDKKSFPCHDARMYVFGMKNGHGAIRQQINEASCDALFDDSVLVADPSKLVPVDSGVINLLRSTLLAPKANEWRKKRKK